MRYMLPGSLSSYVRALVPRRRASTLHVQSVPALVEANKAGFFGLLEVPFNVFVVLTQGDAVIVVDAYIIGSTVSIFSAIRVRTLEKHTCVVMRGRATRLW